MIKQNYKILMGQQFLESLKNRIYMLCSFQNYVYSKDIKEYTVMMIL